MLNRHLHHHPRTNYFSLINFGKSSLIPLKNTFTSNSNYRNRVPQIPHHQTLNESIITQICCTQIIYQLFTPTYFSRNKHTNIFPQHINCVKNFFNHKTCHLSIFFH